MPPRANRLLGEGLRSCVRALSFGRILLALLLVTLLARPAVGASSGETGGYLIGPGDNLSILVWRQDDLSTTVTVRPDGRITIPLFEDIVAAGKAPEALARDIEGQLSEFILDPQVSVVVNSGVGDLRQRIRIVGEAVSPTVLPYSADMTLLDAMIGIGGLAPHADGNGATLIRRTAAGQEEIPLRLDDLMAGDDLTANLKLEPGDSIVIPEGFFSGSWTVNYSYNATQVFTDNIDQDPDGQETEGLISRSGFGVVMSGDAARIRGALNANLALVSQFGGDDGGMSLDPAISGTSNTELYRDHAFIDVNAAISRQVLDTRTRSGTAGGGASTVGSDTIITFSASPYIVHRLGSFADAQWRYRITPVLVASNSASDVLDHEVSLGLSSGRDFSNVGWDLTGRVGQEVRKGERDTHDANVDLNLTVPVSNSFALLGGIGFEVRDDNDDDFSGITWNGGFRWTPSPDTTVRATYGMRDDGEDLDAQVDYRIGPHTTFSASFSESLDSSQGRAAQNLSQIGIDPDTGGLIGGGGNQPFDPDLGPFTFNDEATRTRSLDATISHQSGNNSITFNGRAGRDTGDSDENFYEANVSWNRPLNSTTSLNADAGYERSEFKDEDRNDNTYTAGASLSYRLWSNVSSSISYDFEKRQATDGADSFVENSITLSATISF